MNDGSIDLGIDLTKYGVDKHIRAKEELRAELSAVFTCAELEINYNVQNHANYINSWLKIFKEDKSELWSALSDSSKVADLIIDYESIIEQEAVYDELEVVTPDSNKELDQPVLTNNEFNIKENKGIDL